MATKIVLASSSPRRLALLSQLGLTAEALAPDINESRHSRETPGRFARRMALSKAKAVDARLGGCDAVLVAADTVIALDDDIFGKPADADDAIRMLSSLSGREHSVFTAVAVGRIGGSFACKLAETRVWLRATTRAEREAYWQTGEPAGKAGGYAIQGIGAAFVERIEGNYPTVVGLPLFEMLTLLAAHGVVVPGAAENGNA